MESALRESEARVRAILDTAVDAIITIDGSGIIESFNKAAEGLFGYQPEEVIGRNVSMLMPQPYRDQHDMYLSNYLGTGRARIIGVGREVLAQRKDGTSFPADLAVSEVRLHSRRLFTGIIRDISERKRLERQILQISDREKQKIGQDLHDSLGQLLTGIGFKSKALQSRIAAKHTAEAQTAGQIADLVTQAIRDARSLAHGLQPVEPKPTGLMLALTELATSITEVFKMPCTLVCDPPVELADTAAATQLYRIAQEACNNALKHAHAMHIRIELKRDDGKVIVIVSDDGCGYFPGPSLRGGMGLQIMHYRAAMVGATLSVGPGAAGGTIVRCELAAIT
jgi:PAS domain S-box-containing protein